MKTKSPIWAGRGTPLGSQGLENAEVWKVGGVKMEPKYWDTVTKTIWDYKIPFSVYFVTLGVELMCLELQLSHL